MNNGQWRYFPSENDLNFSLYHPIFIRPRQRTHSLSIINYQLSIKNTPVPLFSWDESMPCILRGATHVRGIASPLSSARTGRRAGSTGVLPPVRGAGGFQPGPPSLKLRIGILLPCHGRCKTDLPQGFLGPDHFSPVQVAALQTQNQHFCRSQIGGAGDIVAVAQMQGLHHALILPGIVAVWVGEQ